MSIEQNCKVQGYLKNVCSHIKWTETHQQVKQELLTHIEDCISEYVAEGLPEQEAIQKAIDRMGDSETLGKQLHQTHRPPTDWKLLFIVAILTGIGLIALYSIEMQGLLTGRVSVPVFSRSLSYTLLGLVALLGMTYFDYRKLKVYGWHLFAGTMFVWLMILVLSNTVINGKPYLNLGFIVINYVDAVTPAFLAVALASIFINKEWSKNSWFLSPVLLLVVPDIFYIMSSSWATAGIYTVMFLAIMLLSGVDKKQLICIASIPISLFVFSILTAPYRLSRLLSFINPYTDPTGSGYLYIQSIEAIKSAGLWGQGFSMVVNLPEIHTDFIFPYIVHAFGWVAGAVVVVLALALVGIMMSVAIKIKDRYGRLMVGGLTCIFAMHFIWNILMTLGYAPLSDINLPFFSYGGSQTFINMAIIGLVLSVYRRKGLLSKAHLN
ncbi:FtsW/RodA/SpoVE family cell cycle protein [Desulfotomaculum defluvii]